MKKNVFLLLVFICSSIYGQEICSDVLQTKIIDKIKDYPSDQLVPYYSKKTDMWGYSYKETGKKLTEPIIKHASFFAPNTSFYFLGADKKFCAADVKGSSEGYKVLSSEPYQAFEVSASSSGEKTSIKDKIREGIKGFEVDAQGKLSAFNRKYYDETENTATIYDITFLKGKYYAAVGYIKDGETVYAIIDEFGNYFDNFKDSKYAPYLCFGYVDADDIWYVLKKDDGNYSLCSLLTNKKIENITENPYQLNYKYRTIGYSIVTCNKKDGILDLVTMKWKIEPAAKNDFAFMYYASKENIELKTSKITSSEILENRKKVSIYIRSSKQEFYDLNNKKYRVK